MSETVNGVISDAGEALTLIERLTEAPLNVILVVLICILSYALFQREKKYISLNRKYGRSKSILTGLLMKDEGITAVESEKRVYDLLERSQ